MRNALIIALLIFISSLVVRAWSSRTKTQNRDAPVEVASASPVSEALLSKRSRLKQQLKAAKTQLRNQFTLIQSKMEYAPRSVRAVIKAQSEGINERHEQLKADLHRIDQMPEERWATFEARAIKNVKALQQEVAAHFERLEVKSYLSSL